MRTARSSSRRGGYLVLGGCPPDTPQTRPPWDQTPPTRHAPQDQAPPPPGPDPPPLLWTEFLTQASENITLPQTSFAGGN